MTTWGSCGYSLQRGKVGRCIIPAKYVAEPSYRGGYQGKEDSKWALGPCVWQRIGLSDRQTMKNRFRLVFSLATRHQQKEVAGNRRNPTGSPPTMPE
ncbi:hypothetical protein [Burkholderia multivorans]|uniref:hypothetical protein n=1 Tax=Burkholderia multivorans TaxID=87883 RepID=UPI00350FA069